MKVTTMDDGKRLVVSVYQNVSGELRKILFRGIITDSGELQLTVVRFDGAGDAVSNANFVCNVSNLIREEYKKGGVESLREYLSPREGPDYF